MLAGQQRVLILAALCLALTIALSLAAAGSNVLPGDIASTRAIQGVDFAGVDRLERVGYTVGSPLGIYTVGIAVIIVLLASRNFIDVVLVVAVLALRSTNPWIKDVIESPRPTPDLVRVAADATGDPGSFGFPSGHVMGTVLLYGAIIYLARTHIRTPRLRRATRALATTAIAVTALSRIYSGAHWPSDTLGGLLWGTLLLVAGCLVHRMGARLVGPVTRHDCE